MSRQGSQTVFRSSKSPAKARTTQSVAKPATTRAAGDDLWSGVKSATASPIAAAEASGGNGGGLGTGAIIGLAIIGLGIVGLSGALIATTGRRRAASKSNTR